MSFWRHVVEGAHELHERHRQVGFAVAVIALAAKISRADGAVSARELRAFHDMFQVSADEEQHVAHLFDQAARHPEGFEHYAHRAARLFRDESEVLEKLLDGLFHIATADRVADEREIAFLRRVAHIFGFDGATFARIAEAHIGRDEADPYLLLGIGSEASDEELRAAWRSLVRIHHPDRLIARGMPEELIGMATQRLAAINAAYDGIRAQRGLKAAVG
jgi:DnaJ like chaperone protein